MANNVNYKKITFYQSRGASTSTGFSTFSENGLYYFTCNKSDEVYLFSVGFTSAAARNRNLHKLSENLLFAKSYERIQESKNRFYFLIQTDEQEELARSKFFATEDAMNVFIGWIMGSKFVIDYSQNTENQKPNVNTTILKGNYNRYINYTIYKGNNQKIYFAYSDKDDNTYLLNPIVSGFDNVEEVKKMVETVSEVARRPKAYKVNLAKNGKYFFYLKNNTETLAKSIHFNNEKEMLEAIEKLVNNQTSNRTVISSKLNNLNNNGLTGSEKDDFEEVLKEQQKAELEVRLKKQNNEAQKKQEQTDLSLEQVYQNKLNVKEKEISEKDQKNNKEDHQNGKLNGEKIEPPLKIEALADNGLIAKEENDKKDNTTLNTKKLKVRTVDANKPAAVKADVPEKKLKVRTVDANKPVEKKEVVPEKKLKVRTVDANKKVIAKAVKTDIPIEVKDNGQKKKLKVRTVDANKPSTKTAAVTNKKINEEKKPLPVVEKAKENTDAEITYQKKLAQEKLETLKRGAQNEKKEQVKTRKKKTKKSDFSIVKIIKPAIVMLLVFAMVGFGILAFLSRDKQYDSVKPATVAVVESKPDKSGLPQFKPSKITASAASISNFKQGTVEQLLKNCIEDVYCAIPANFHWIEANFEDGLSILPENSKASLLGIIELMKGYPEMKLAIAGHTAFGEIDKNMASLSEVRAKTVFDYFTDNGISTERLSHKGLADTQPISFGNGLTAKRQNKRVDFTLIQK